MTPRSGPPQVRRAARSPGLTERAYRELRDAIGDLILQPGQPLTESSLAEWLGIGRTPVREALMRLRDEGLIEVVARKGYYVTRITADDANEIYEMLEGIEGMAIKLATERAQPSDLARLRKAIDAQQTALDNDDLDAWVPADEDFHNGIIDIARNQQIKKTIQPLNTRLHRFRTYTIHVRPKPTASTEAHREQLHAMERGDGDLARQLIQQHRAEYRHVLIDILRKLTGPHGGI